VVWLTAGLLAGCGGGFSIGFYSDPYDPPTPASAWVTIDPVSEPTTVSDHVWLTGTAFISPTWWHCCGGTAQEMTAVTVTWRNETSGQSGFAFQSVETGLFVPLYNHTWSATVPLVPGVNTIAVTASDPAGLTATERVLITRTGV
jgi:hypothetical protein